MPQDNDLLHLQHLDGKFEGRGNPMVTGGRLEWRHQRCDIPNYEYLARIDIEDLCGIDPAVGTGDHHHFRRLPFAQARPTLPVASPGTTAKPAVPLYQVLERRGEAIDHAAPNACTICLWQGPLEAPKWQP